MKKKVRTMGVAEIERRLDIALSGGDPWRGAKKPRELKLSNAAVRHAREYERRERERELTAFAVKLATGAATIKDAIGYNMLMGTNI